MGGVSGTRRALARRYSGDGRQRVTPKPQPGPWCRPPLAVTPAGRTAPRRLACPAAARGASCVRFSPPGRHPPCSGPARPEHRPAAASRRSLQAYIASLPLQSSWMSKTYLKSDHFNGGGSRPRPPPLSLLQEIGQERVILGLGM